ncbi:MAG: hypothetical protein HYX27_26985 [Acidobacteria bacterium]|nr:hypothetical protein [Acidobacteriota bacterium]
MTEWTVDELKLALENAPSSGGQTLVTEWLDGADEASGLIVVYFHLDNTKHPDDQSGYDFTFDQSETLTKNFASLWESVARLQKSGTRADTAVR